MQGAATLADLYLANKDRCERGVSKPTHLLQLEDLVEVVLEGEEAVSQKCARRKDRQHEAHLDKRGQRMPG